MASEVDPAVDEDVLTISKNRTQALKTRYLQNNKDCQRTLLVLMADRPISGS
ncbi:MAG TPA: hypothetical protein VKA91_10790 [Nitrososphaeraceae archaeon]|nr:hypothetical protein [Nitrososphaeraceae archaeon]